jgi:hypothetical protein
MQRSNRKFVFVVCCIPESFGGHYRVTDDLLDLLIECVGGRSRRSCTGAPGGKMKN